MHVPLIVLIVAIEIYVGLLIAAIALFLFSRQQKSLLRRQQEKLLQLIAEIKNAAATPPSSSKTYKDHINEQLESTQTRFSLIAPHSDITATQFDDHSLSQRIVALRYAFLRAEELGTTEASDTDKHWDIFQQTLEPLLQQTSPETDIPNEELETYKKRVENLEKFKKLFFDLEKQWNEAQANAHNYYQELSAMADTVADPQKYQQLLGSYHDIYDSLNSSIYNTNQALLGQPGDVKTINIIRQDPRAADEIIKLRNVAADQYRIISNLQKKLESAVTEEEKALVIQELEQQLQRQIRFVQESDTCVQLLEEELAKANEKIAEQESLLDGEHSLNEENAHIKETLHNFTLESKDLLSNLDKLEKENHLLKENLEHASTHEQMASEPTLQNNDAVKQIQTEFTSLQKQYAELEEKYLELKFK